MRVGLVAATIEDAAGVVPITRSKERGLLCLLALTPGRVVSVDRLIDGLWGDDPPRTAAKTLQTYVKNLRGRIAEAGAPRDTLRTEPPGYLLAIEDDDVDLLRFEQRCRTATDRAASGDATQADELFASALELVAPEDFLAFDGPGLDGARVRYVEQRRQARDAHVDVQLALGRHRELIAPLSARLDHEPQHEHGWAQLMIALYRSDRQRDAVQAFSTARDVLRDEFGLEPGPALVELERQILHHDVPELPTAPSGQSAPTDPAAEAVSLLVWLPGEDAGSRSEPRALVDLAIEPGRWLLREDTAHGHRVVVSDVATAARIALRLRQRNADVCIVASKDQDQAEAQHRTDLAESEETIVFASAISAALPESQWQHTGFGRSPVSDTRHVLRMPSTLDRLRDRSPVHIERAIASAFRPHLQASAQGEVRALQLAGPAGMGKSSLLADVASTAIDTGHAVLYCQADADQSSAQNPLVEAAYQAVISLSRGELDDHVGTHGAVLGHRLPEIKARVGTNRQVVDQPASPAEIESALVDLIQRLARNQPVLLLIDDAPWLSDDDVKLVHRLGTDARTASLCIVFACRTRDPNTPPLAPKLLDLCAGATSAIDLSPFTIDQVARFLESAASVERSPRTAQVAHLVHRTTEGLPLFVREVAHDMVGSRDWFTSDGKWRIDRNADEVSLPSSLQELLGRRLDHLDTEAGSLASIGAVFGEFSTLLAASVSELPVADVLAALDQLIDHRVVEPIPGLTDHYRFTHPLLREAALATIGPGRRTAIALAAAELMSAQPNPSERQYDRRAELWYQALPLAPYDRVESELAIAATAAQDRGDFTRAILHLRRLVQVAESAGRQVSPQTLVALAEASTRAQTEAGQRRNRARAAFDASLTAADPDLAARAALAFAGPFNPFGSLVNTDAEGEAMARRALDLQVESPQLRAELWGMIAAARSDVNGAAAELGPALDLAMTSQEPLVIGRMLSLAHALQSAEAPVRDRLRVDEQIVDIGRTAGAPSLELQGWGWTAAHGFEAGDIALLDLAATKRSALADRLDDTTYRWSDLVYRSMRHAIAGRFAQAEAASWQALEVGRLPLGDHANRFFGLQLLKLSEMQGRGAQLLESTEAFANQLGYVTAYVSLAHLYAETGDTDRAQELVAAHVPGDLAELLPTYDRLPTLAQLARIAQLTEDAPLAGRVAEQLVGSIDELCVHADAVLYGSVRHNLARCAIATGDSSAAMALLDQSIATYQALDAAAWLLYLDADRCMALDQRGDTEQAAALRDKVAKQAMSLGVAVHTGGE